MGSGTATDGNNPRHRTQAVACVCCANGEILGTKSPGLPDITAQGQGGLLDIALAHDFATSRMIFISYSTAANRSWATAIARARPVEDGASIVGRGRDLPA